MLSRTVCRGFVGMNIENYGPIFFSEIAIGTLPIPRKILKNRMTNIKDSLNHAFSLEPDSNNDSDGLPEALERLASTVAAKNLATPALLFLETMAPLNFIGSQFMYATMPFVKLFSTSEDYYEIAMALENRNTVRLFADRIEELACKGA